MIDLHTHLLPGVDDGPPDDAGSVELARAAVACGVRAMAATPHIGHVYPVEVASLARRRSQLAAVLADAGVALEVLQGGEITGSRLMELSADELSALTLGGGRHVLLECPFTAAGQMFDHAVFRAQSLGFDVLLGHPERSPEFIARPERLIPLIERGALAQLTAASLAGRFGRTVQGAAFAMLEAGCAHVIASDAHDAVKRGPGDLATVFASVDSALPGAAEFARYWVTDTPAAIVSGAVVGPPPVLRRAGRARRLAGRLSRPARS